MRCGLRGRPIPYARMLDFDPPQGGKKMPSGTMSTSIHPEGPEFNLRGMQELTFNRNSSLFLSSGGVVMPIFRIVNY